MVQTPNGSGRPGRARFWRQFDDVVYGVYVRERDIMEIPASTRLFMGDTVTWHALPYTPENERRSSHYNAGRMTTP